MLLPSFLRNPIARSLRALPIKGRWRIASLLNRLFAAEQTTFHLNGVGRMTLDLGIEMQQHIYWAGLSREDAAMVRLARAVLPRDGVFVDVGANVGLHTLAIAAHVAEGGAVVAFEPHPVNHRLLVHNLEQNQLRHAVAENLGLSDTATTLTGCASTAGGNWSLASQGGYRFEVRLVRLDDYWDEHPLPRLDLIKIDVEGAEVRVLRGARRTIERFQPLIVFEVCPSWLAKMHTNAAELFAELIGHGYSIHRLPRHHITWDGRVTVGELAALGPGAFVNLVAVPPRPLEKTTVSRDAQRSAGELPRSAARRG